ncbi:MAG: hypothetical protein ACK4IX_02930, partial [Candidatus Sericytochromatia bacterium]
MRIEKFIYVINFEANKSTRVLLDDKINNFVKEVNGSLFEVEVPFSAPAELPRVLIQTNDTIIKICNNRFEIEINRNITVEKEIVNIKDIIKKIILNLFDDRLVYKWTGFISNIYYKSNNNKISATEFITPYVKKVLSLSIDNKDLASFDLKLGFYEDENKFAVNYDITGYTLMKLEKDIKEQQETGIRITLDIHNKNYKQEKNLLSYLESIVN